MIRRKVREVEGLVLAREKMTAYAAHRAGYLRLPPGYHLEMDADLLELRRTDGSQVAAFSARAASPATVVREAEEDHRRHGRSTA